MTAPVIACQWDGEAFRPHSRFSKICASSFVIGELYDAEFIEHRSMRSHRHYFADLKTAWMNLPETISGEFPTPEHLRARGLIETGYRDEFRFVCSTSRDAANAAAACTRGNDYAVVSINDRVAVVLIPKSQSLKAMGNVDFKASKQAVLDWAWGLVGLKPQYRENAA
jgi:hypothetical protein